MATFAFTQEQFDEFKESSGKTFRILAESTLSIWNFSSVITYWADISATEEPPHVRMYTDTDDISNMSYMTKHGGFVTGNVYVIFDNNVINKYNIKTGRGKF